MATGTHSGLLSCSAGPDLFLCIVASVTYRSSASITQLAGQYISKRSFHALLQICRTLLQSQRGSAPACGSPCFLSYCCFQSPCSAHSMLAFWLLAVFFAATKDVGTVNNDCLWPLSKSPLVIKISLIKPIPIISHL